MSISANAFQTPNIYIDQAMELLTDSEFRVLIFISRHIMGWQGSIDERQNKISLSVFEHGRVTQKGYVCKGCGLGRGTIIKALESLVKYGFIEKVGIPTDKGQEWKMRDEGIDLEGLTKRNQESETARKHQTIKATIAASNKRSGTSNVTPTGTSNVTMQGIVERTSTGTLDVPMYSHGKSQAKSHDEKSIPMPFGMENPNLKLLPATIPVSAKTKSSEPIKRFYFEAVALGAFEISDFKGLSKESRNRIGLLEKIAKSMITARFPVVTDEQGALLIQKYCAAEKFKPNLQGAPKFELGLAAWLEKKAPYIPNFLATQAAKAAVIIADDNGEYVDPELVKKVLAETTAKLNGNTPVKAAS